MATLTETARQTRNIIKWGAILLIAFFVGKASLRLFGVAWQFLNPPEEAPPTVYFGKLPSIKFPEQERPDFTFRLETIEGGLPIMADVTTIYFIPENDYGLLTYEDALEKARLLEFESTPTKLSEVSESTYRWVKDELIPSTLTMEIIEQNFSLRYAYEKDQSLLNLRNLITPDQALEEVTKYLQKARFWPGDLKNSPYHLFYRYLPPNLVKVPSLSEADFVKVNYLRTDINELPVLPADPWNANINALVSKSEKKRIIALNYTYFPIDLDLFGTYPLKDPTLAWSELKEGGGYIAHQGDNETGEVIIRKVYLAYFDPPNHQNYLQPVFVFEGDKNFMAYVSAISPEWIEAD